jgi:hypothetical protein
MIAAFRERMRNRWAQLLERPFWRLVVHFGLRVFSGNGEGGLGLGVGAMLALLAAPGAFISILLMDKYSSLLRFLREERTFDAYASSLPDQYFFLTFSMAVTGIVTVLKWDSIFPDRRDYMNLAPLPIATRRIFLANITAIVLIAVAFAVDVNAISSFFFPLIVTMEEPRFAAYIHFARAHFAGVVLASLFTFFSMFAVIGLLMTTLPESVFRRVSIYLRVLLVVLLLGMLCTAFAVAPALRSLAHDSHSWLRWLPPAWFLGWARALMGRAGGALTELSRTGAGALLGAALLAPAVYVLSYYRYFVRIPETLNTIMRNREPRRLLPMKLMDRLILRTDFERATFRFALKTLLRNDRHSLLLGAFAGVGFVIASQTLVAALGQKTDDAGSTSAMALLSAPLVLAYFLICGLRFVFDLPAELRANWVHRVILDRKQPGIATMARKIILAFVLPWVVALCLPLYLYLWGAMTGGALFAVLMAGCYLMPEILLRRFRKIPFACAYPAWKQNATVIVLLYVLGLWAFAFLLPGLELALLARSNWYLWGLALLLVSTVLVLRNRHRDEESVQELVFDEVADSPFELLNLSGR